MRKNPRTSTFRRTVRRLLTFAASGIVLAGAAWAATPGRCVTARVPWAFVLPDGSVQPAGSLSVCLSRIQNPVTGLHEVRVGRRAIGMFMSRLGAGEDVGESSPVVVFEMTAGGSFRLAGYTWPNGDQLETFRLYDSRASEAERLLACAPLLEPGSSDDTVLLAAVPGQR